MKHLRSIFVVIFATLALSVSAPAQVTVQTFAGANVSNGPVMTFHVNVDSLNTYTTSSFSLYGYDAESFQTYPISCGKLLTSAGTPRVSAYIDGSFGFNTWSVVDTIMTTDSIKTFADGTLDLNNKKYPKYRIRVLGSSGNRRDTQLDLGLYTPKKSY